MNDDIYKGTLSVFQKCKIKQFPIDCFAILNKYEYSIKKYSALTKKKLFACMKLSEDATIIEDTVYYNDSMPQSRVRFSIMHELGHIVLATDVEQYANQFASHILAPRIAIHYSKCKNAADVMKRFDLSEEASNYAFDDYRRWRREITLHGMCSSDKEMYQQFYNEEANKFVWRIRKCDYCYTKNVYNEDTLCNSCKLFALRKQFVAEKRTDPFESDLDILRGNWLYRNL